jgi:hypothetical protein
MADTTNEAKAVYTKPTTQLDMEERLAKERGDVPEELLGRDFSGGRPPEELDAFVGVDPVYRNYADDTNKPYFAEEGAEGAFENRHTDGSDMIVTGLPQEHLDTREEAADAAFKQNEKTAKARAEGTPVPQDATPPMQPGPSAAASGTSHAQPKRTGASEKSSK